MTFGERARGALAYHHPYRFRVLREGTPSAVLMLWGFGVGDPEPRLLITKRTETLASHKGQYAFPGGAYEDADEAAGGMRATALRETEEEVGIASHEIDVLGALPELSTPSGFRIDPFVGVLHRPIEEVPACAAADEIALTLWVPLSILAPAYRLETVRLGNREFDTDVFQIDDHRIWGATGAMIQNFRERLDRFDREANRDATESGVRNR